MAGLLLAVAMLAAPPFPSRVLTVKAASIVVGSAVPAESQLFSDKQEVLETINTANHSAILCQLGMSTILARNK